MDEMNLSDLAELPETEPDHADNGYNSDEDGLGSPETPESCDQLYLRQPSVANEAATAARPGELRILHSSGASKMKRKPAPRPPSPPFPGLTAGQRRTS